MIDISAMASTLKIVFESGDMQDARGLLIGGRRRFATPLRESRPPGASHRPASSSRRRGQGVPAPLDACGRPRAAPAIAIIATTTRMASEIRSRAGGTVDSLEVYLCAGKQHDANGSDVRRVLDRDRGDARNDRRDPSSRDQDLGRARSASTPQPASGSRRCIAGEYRADRRRA